MTLILFVQMLGLNIYSYVEDDDIKFYKAQKSIARKMDVLDWIPGAFAQEYVMGGVRPMDVARRINPEEIVILGPFAAPEPLVGVHPGLPALTEAGEPGEEEVEEEEEAPLEGDVEEGATGYTQESEAPLRKKAMLTATPQSKLVPAFSVDDARDMYSRDATANFRERRKLKGKKLYGDYSVDETIAISSEDEDDFELGKRLREEPTGPGGFASNIPVKPEVLTVEEANEKMRQEEEQRVRLAKAAAEAPSMRDEVAELRALLLEQSRQRAVPQTPSSAELISQVIQGMMAQGLVMATPTAFPQMPPPYHPPTGPASSSFGLQGMMMHGHPRPYAPVQQVDDPHLWRQGTPGSSRPLTPPPLRPPINMPPPHQPDDPGMFGSTDPNPPAPPVPEDDVPMVEAEGLQGPGDTSTPNPVDESMHEPHAEAVLDQRPDSQPLIEQVVSEPIEEEAGDRGAPEQSEAPSAAPVQDQGEVMH